MRSRIEIYFLFFILFIFIFSFSITVIHMEGLDLSWGFVPIPEESDRGVAELAFDGLLPKPLKVQQDGGAAGCGGKLWPAGELLSRYWIRQPSLKYKKILELGSGTGLAGLALAVGHPEAKDMNIYITDQDNMMSLMNANITLNEENTRVHAAMLDWGQPLPEYCQDVDLILAADCVYLESAFPLLEKTLMDLTEEGDVPILMAYKRRRKADRLFFKAMKHNFDIREVQDFPEFERFYKENVFLFSMTRIRK